LPLPHFALLLISVAKLKLHPSKCAEVVEGLHCSLENGWESAGKTWGENGSGCALSYLSFTLPPPRQHWAKGFSGEWGLLGGDCG